jgi:hypothetical protein
LYLELEPYQNASGCGHTVELCYANMHVNGYIGLDRWVGSQPESPPELQDVWGIGPEAEFSDMSEKH